MHEAAKPARPELVTARAALQAGALAGLIGGLPFGLAMRQLGMLPSIAALVRASSPIVGMLTHLVVAMIIGAVFGLLMRRQRCSAGELVYWGLAYGAIWWLLGPLTLMPLMLAAELTWDLDSARAAVPSLLGHLVYGGVTGLVWVIAIRGRAGLRIMSRPGWKEGIRGAVAGSLAMIALTLLAGPVGQGEPGWVELLSDLPGTGDPLLPWIALTVLSGLAFAWLEPDAPRSAGLAIARGLAFGFVLWLLLRMSLLPLTAGQGLAWSGAEVSAALPDLIGALLFGALLGALLTLLDRGLSFLLEDASPRWDDAGLGLGTGGPRVLVRGVLSGLAGGLLFAYVLWRTQTLVEVAGLIGAQTAAAGMALHLLISAVVGAGYALLYRRLSYGAGSALAWGLVYGLLWWLLGPLTLMPLLLGAAPQWNAAAASGLTASLFGHLVYGAGLGLVFHALSLRHLPWWVPRSHVEARRLSQQRAQLFSSAPALWSLLLLLAVFIPLVLAIG